MKSFNKANLKGLRIDIDTALMAVAEKHGIQLKIGNISFNEEMFTTKLQADIIPEDGMSIAQKEFNRYCGMYGLKPEHFGFEFFSNNRVFSISGIKPRSSKYPIVAKTPDGVGYKFTLESIERHINRKS